MNNALQKLKEASDLFARRATTLSKEIADFEAAVCVSACIRYEFGDDDNAVLSVAKDGKEWQLMLAVGGEEPKHVTELPVEGKLVVYSMREKFLDAYATVTEERAEELDRVLYPDVDATEANV